MGGEEEASWLSSLIDQADNLILTIGGYDIDIPDSTISDNESDSDDDEEYDSGFEEDHTEQLAARISVGSKVAAAGQGNDDVDVPREENVTTSTTGRRSMLPSPSRNGKGRAGVHETQDEEFGGVKGEAVENIAGEEATSKTELFVLCSDKAPPQPGTDSSREDERRDKVPERLASAPEEGDAQIVTGMHLPSARGGPLPFAFDPMLKTPAHSRDRDGLQWEPPQVGLSATGEVSRRIRRDRHRTVNNSSARGESARAGAVHVPSKTVNVPSADTFCAKTTMSPSSPLPPVDSAEEPVNMPSPDTPSCVKTATSPSSPVPRVENAVETVSMLSADTPSSDETATHPLPPVESVEGDVITPSSDTSSSTHLATSTPVECAGDNVRMTSADASSCAKTATTPSCAKTATTTRPSAPSPVPAANSSAAGVDKKPDVAPRKRPGRRFSYVGDTTWLKPKETPEKTPAWQNLGAGVTAKPTTSSFPVGRLPSPKGAGVPSADTWATRGVCVVPPSTVKGERHQTPSDAKNGPLKQDLATAVTGKEEADAGSDMERLSQDSLDEHLGNGAMDARPAKALATMSPKGAVFPAGSPVVHLPEQARVRGNTETSERNGVVPPPPEGGHPVGEGQRGEYREEGCHEAMEEEGIGLATGHGGHDHEHIWGEEEDEEEEMEEGGGGEAGEEAEDGGGAGGGGG
eukprot:jgi/Undpi1/4976/HiC_scaffold_19.g08328.m1